MAYIELHQAVWTHRKTFVLAAALGLEDTYAVAHLSRLWAWALDNVPDGDLTDCLPEVIAFAAGWKGDANDFLSALVKSGYVDNQNGYCLHDWEEYGGKLCSRRIANAERMRSARATHKKSTLQNVQSEIREEKRREEYISTPHNPPPSQNGDNQPDGETAQFAPVVNDLFSHFQRAFNKPGMRLSSQQRQKINAYLKKPKARSPDELKKCIDNAAGDYFYRTLAHKGLEFFIGSEAKVEQFLALEPRPPKPGQQAQQAPKPPPSQKIYRDPRTGDLCTEEVYKARIKNRTDVQNTNAAH